MNQLTPPRWALVALAALLATPIGCGPSSALSPTDAVPDGALGDGGIVRPDGGARGGPRYFMRGIDLRKQVAGLLPGLSTGSQRAAVNRVVVGLGGRTPKLLEIKRR